MDKTVLRVVGICGNPMSGKSTLMKDFMKRIRGGKWELKKYRSLEYHQHTLSGVIVLGRYDDGDTFGGTDRLSMAVINDAEEFLLTLEEPGCRVLFEGDRLFCSRFIKFLMKHSRFLLLRTVIRGAEANRRWAERKKAGTAQEAKFINSRNTKYNNLCTEFPFIQHVLNETISDRNKILSQIVEFIS